MKLPLVAICGRPNVGKSTLFNRLTRTRSALVHDLPGMTRDRSYAQVECLGPEGDVEEVFQLVDTGGLDFDGEDVITAGITRMAEKALEDAHVLLLMVDGHDGATGGDEEIAARLIRMGKPALLIINKMDGIKGGAPDGGFYGLGLPQVFPISASHGAGIQELLEAIRELLPFHRGPEEAELHDPAEEIRFALVGRPNVGKSSLCNKLLGFERSLVSEIPGTTRDTVDSILELEGQVYRLIDTAGIRRKGKTHEGAEKLSIVKAKQAMARADVSLLILDAVEGVTHQDAVIAGYAQDAGAAVILVVNKWDLVEKDTYTSLDFESRFRRELGYLHHAPMIFISALTGQRVTKLYAFIKQVAEAHAKRVSTGELNRFIQDAVAQKSPPSVDGKLVRLFYATQVGVRPPSFVIKTNTDSPLHFSYVRYLENLLRERFGFVGTPIRIATGSRSSKAPKARVRRILDPGEGLKPSRKSKSSKPKAGK